MQMYPGAGYKEHQYKVETEDYIFKDDLLFEKNPAMHGKKAGHHNYGWPNTHPMMRPIDPCKPNHNMHGWAYSGSKYGGPNYCEPVYEQEEMKLHVDKYEVFRHGDRHDFMGHVNHKGGYAGRPMWDCKGIDD